MKSEGDSSSSYSARLVLADNLKSEKVMNEIRPRGKIQQSQKARRPRLQMRLGSLTDSGAIWKHQLQYRAPKVLIREGTQHW